MQAGVALALCALAAVGPAEGSLPPPRWELEAAARKGSDFRRAHAALKAQRDFPRKADGVRIRRQGLCCAGHEARFPMRGAAAQFEQILRLKMAATRIGRAGTGRKREFPGGEQVGQGFGRRMRGKAGRAQGGSLAENGLAQ